MVTVTYFGYGFTNLICIGRNCTGVSGALQEDGACSAYSNFLMSETPSCQPQQTRCLMGMVSGVGLILGILSRVEKNVGSESPRAKLGSYGGR